MIPPCSHPARAVACATLVSLSFLAGCGEEPDLLPVEDTGIRFIDAGSGEDPDAGREGPVTNGPVPELWYAVDERLVRIWLSAEDGSVLDIKASDIVGPIQPGYNALTVLSDGSLLGSRLDTASSTTSFYHVAEPPRDGSDATATAVGVMPESIMIEGLYLDCMGRIYAMDTGSDDTDATGNRLLRFTGNPLEGEFDYEVVTDLGTSDIADIDDLGPGIGDGVLVDNPGFAIDSGRVFEFDYESGTGREIATGGTWGIHVLGGQLFTDRRPRLYVLGRTADVFEMDPVSLTLSESLGQGPPIEGDDPLRPRAGWSGLAGPLTDCDTDFLD